MSAVDVVLVIQREGGRQETRLQAELARTPAGAVHAVTVDFVLTVFCWSAYMLSAVVHYSTQYTHTQATGRDGRSLTVL